MNTNTKFATETPSWTIENARGRDGADELISNMKKQEAPTLLGHTVKAMTESGVSRGYEVGFFHRIAERLMAGC